MVLILDHNDMSGLDSTNRICHGSNVNRLIEEAYSTSILFDRKSTISIYMLPFIRFVVKMYMTLTWIFIMGQDQSKYAYQKNKIIVVLQFNWWQW